MIWVLLLLGAGVVGYLVLQSQARQKAVASTQVKEAIGPPPRMKRSHWSAKVRDAIDARDMKRLASLLDSELGPSLEDAIRSLLALNDALQGLPSEMLRAGEEGEEWTLSPWVKAYAAALDDARRDVLGVFGPLHFTTVWLAMQAEVDLDDYELSEIGEPKALAHAAMAELDGGVPFHEVLAMRVVRQVVGEAAPAFGEALKEQPSLRKIYAARELAVAATNIMVGAYTCVELLRRDDEREQAKRG